MRPQTVIEMPEVELSGKEIIADADGRLAAEQMK